MAEDSGLPPGAGIVTVQEYSSYKYFRIHLPAPPSELHYSSGDMANPLPTTKELEAWLTVVRQAYQQHIHPAPLLPHFGLRNQHAMPRSLYDSNDYTTMANWADCVACAVVHSINQDITNHIDPWTDEEMITAMGFRMSIDPTSTQHYNDGTWGGEAYMYCYCHDPTLKELALQNLMALRLQRQAQFERQPPPPPACQLM